MRDNYSPFRAITPLVSRAREQSDVFERDASRIISRDASALAYHDEWNIRARSMCGVRDAARDCIVRL